MINAVQQPMSVGSGPVKQNFSNFASTDLNGKIAFEFSSQLSGQRLTKR